MRIGIVTDEITLDIKQALTIGLDWGIKDYELRCIGTNRVPYIAPKEIDIIQHYRKNHGIKITALSPGIFKVPLSDNKTIKKELKETLPLTYDLAQKLDCSRIIIFGLKKLPEEENNLNQVLELLTQTAQEAKQHKITLLVENEPGFWCDSGTNTARILEAVNSPCLKANWDPANAVGQGEKPYPDGYQRIKKFIANLHIKDTVKDALKECVLVGDGVIDWPGQLGAVIKEQQLDHVTLETHCLPSMDKSKENLKRVRKIIAQFK